jgi:hypothetical protein
MSFRGAAFRDEESAPLQYGESPTQILVPLATNGVLKELSADKDAQQGHMSHRAARSAIKPNFPVNSLIFAPSMYKNKAKVFQL